MTKESSKSSWLFNRYSAYDRFMVISLAALLFSQCANRLSLEGGPKDERPPALILSKSDANYVKHFDRDELTLIFDEFLQLDRPAEQIVVSPPLQYSLRTIVRGKKVIVQFDDREELQDSTTYTIQFGKAIQDLTEGNPAQNLRYVFSTGHVIDSMMVHVHATDVITGEPVIGALIMLYDHMSDTVIRSGRPLYFSYTDSLGMASVENCKAGRYRIVGLMDENKNYHLDLPEEWIGALDTLIEARHDDSTIYDLPMYREIEPPILTDSRKLDTMLYALTMDGNTPYIQWKTKADPMWQDFIDEDTVFIKTSLDTLVYTSPYDEPDTLLTSKIRKKGKGNRFARVVVRHHKSHATKQRIKVEIQFNVPIVTFNRDSVFVIDTSHRYVAPKGLDIQSDSQSVDKLVMKWNGRALGDSILLLPGAVRTWTTTNDSMVIHIKPIDEETLSHLIVNIAELDSTRQYILELSDQEESVLFSQIIRNTRDRTIEIPGLTPGHHRLELVTDFNGNGIKDGGWFNLRQFPEPASTLEINNLKANWDVEVDISP